MLSVQQILNIWRGYGALGLLHKILFIYFWGATTWGLVTLGWATS